MSSLTLSIPTGLITTPWCIAPQYDTSFAPSQCANSTQQPSDFQTFCCAGSIIDTTQDLYNWPSPGNRTFDLQNLVCCLVPGSDTTTTGLQPVPTARQSCTAGQATPLLSLAATSTGNAAYYPITITSGSVSTASDTTVYGDYKPVQTPTCLWVYTASGVSLSDITVPTAQVSTMPLTTDMFGHTYGGSATSTESSAAETGSSASGSSTAAETTVVSGTASATGSATSSGTAAAATTSASAGTLLLSTNAAVVVGLACLLSLLFGT
ncbi:hypothetical protein LTR95_004928 [Oleoguttula sp. CCFEE 5521]